MGQHGFDTAVNTQTDPPGAAPTGAKSDVDDCLVTIIYKSNISEHVRGVLNRTRYDGGSVAEW